MKWIFHPSGCWLGYKRYEYWSINNLSVGLSVRLKYCRIVEKFRNFFLLFSILYFQYIFLIISKSSWMLLTYLFVIFVALFEQKNVILNCKSVVWNLEFELINFHINLQLKFYKHFYLSFYIIYFCSLTLIKFIKMYLRG